jgi:hypothetical protein
MGWRDRLQRSVVECDFNLAILIHEELGLLRFGIEEPAALGASHDFFRGVQRNDAAHRESDEDGSDFHSDDG